MVVAACVGSDVKSPRSGAEHKRRRVDKTNYKVISMHHTCWQQEATINKFMREKKKKEGTHPLSHLCWYMRRGLSGAPWLNLGDKRHVKNVTGLYLQHAGSQSRLV